ncbi:Uncharacterised protein [Shigella sonnei]|nr:Uncharacterised protein [Shigella sonnei]
MVEMNCQWMVILLRHRADQRQQIFCTSISECARRSGDDDRRMQVGSGFHHHLHRFEIVNIECRNRITAALCVVQHLLCRYHVHFHILSLVFDFKI